MECAVHIELAPDIKELKQQIKNSNIIIQQNHNNALSEIAYSVNDLLNSGAKFELLLTDIFPIDLNIVCYYGTNNITFTQSEEKQIQIGEFVFKLSISPLAEYNLHQFVWEVDDILCIQKCLINENEQNDIFASDNIHLTMELINDTKQQYISAPREQLLLIYSQLDVLSNDKAFLSIPINPKCIISLCVMTHGNELKANSNIENIIISLQQSGNEYYQYYAQYFQDIKNAIVTQQLEKNRIKQSGIYKFDNYNIYQHISFQQIRTEQSPTDNFIRSVVYAEQLMDQPDIAYTLVQKSEQQFIDCQISDSEQRVQNSLTLRIQFIQTDLNNTKFMNTQFSKQQNNELTIQLQQNNRIENITKIQYINIPVFQTLNQDIFVCINKQIYIRIFIYSRYLLQLKDNIKSSLNQQNALLYLKYCKYVQLTLIQSIYERIQQSKHKVNQLVLNQKIEQSQNIQQIKIEPNHNQTIYTDTSFIEPVIYYAKVIKQTKSPVKRHETISSPPQLLKQLKSKNKETSVQQLPSRNYLKPPERYDNQVIEDLVDEVLILFRRRIQLQYDGIYERLLDERAMLHLIEH